MVRLKRVRLNNGISVNELATAVGISRQAVYSWETENLALRRQPRVQHIKSVADFLRRVQAIPADYSASRLFEEEDTRP